MQTKYFDGLRLSLKNLKDNGRLLRVEGMFMGFRLDGKTNKEIVDVFTKLGIKSASGKQLTESHISNFGKRINFKKVDDYSKPGYQKTNWILEKRKVEKQKAEIIHDFDGFNYTRR